jgi:thiol-disulfide isomerase/thioredoxin
MTLATLCLALFALPPDGAERAGSPIVLDFTAGWCGPCRQMRPAVEQLVRQGYPIKPVDIDRSPELAERYKVEGVPTFVVVDPADGRELARTSGLQPASQLASLYRQASSRYRPSTADPARSRASVEAGPDEPRPADNEADEDAAEDRPAEALFRNPEPWEVVVRIKVHGQGAIGFGSGTVIYSSPDESIILTCAHIFKLDGPRQLPPARFDRQITVDLFDGKLTKSHPRKVHYAQETYEGKAIDYDFARDVGLIRIRPGRRLPYARVVPPHWAPKARMGMITVGCSEGHDATAWSTQIVNSSMRGLQGNGAYEAIECAIAPKQGRSGGGLFTSDGYVAGVCDFAEPRGDHGLYAAPKSIYSVLDRNNLSALYTPVRSPADVDRLLAESGNGRGGPSRRRTVAAASNPRTPAPVARGQSPDREEPGAVTIPPPEMLGIKTPTLAASDRRSAPESARRQTWHASAASTTDLKLDPSLDTDRFDTAGSTPSPTFREPAESVTPAPPETPRRGSAPGRWRAGRSPLPGLDHVGSN